MTHIFISQVHKYSLAIVLLSSVYCEVIMKETKIDPVSFLFEKQNILIDKINSISDRVTNLEETKMEEINPSDRCQSSEKLTEIYFGILKMEEKFDEMFKDIAVIKSLQLKKQESNCACKYISELTNESSEENETLSKNKTNSEKFSSIMNMPNNINIDKLTKHRIDSKNVLSIIQNISLHFNNSNEHEFSQIRDTFLHTFNTTNLDEVNKFILEEPYNISSVLLETESSKQKKSENPIETTVIQELKDLKTSLLSEVDEINNALNITQLLLEKTPENNNSFINDEVTNKTYEDYLLNSDYSELVVQQNALNDASDFYMSLQIDALSNKTDILNETLTAQSIGSLTTFLNSLRKLLPIDSHDKNTTIINQVAPSEKEVELNQAKLTHLNEATDGVSLDSLFNLSKLSTSNVLQEIQSLHTTLSYRIKKMEEQIIGFKIYQTSALHSHMKEVRFELSKTREEIFKSMASNGKKLNKKLESNKHSLFTYVNAAVTSITSSTVSSSKATGVAISKTLRNIFQQLQTKFLETSWFGQLRCPGLYQKVGSSCLLSLENVKASWRETCKLCSALGGIIPEISKKDLFILKQILSNGTDGFWLKTENSSTHSDHCNENSLTSITDKFKNNRRVCTAYMTNITAIEDIPCTIQLSVVCQKPKISLNTLSKKFNISTILSNLDSFLTNSKYYNINNNYV